MRFYSWTLFRYLSTRFVSSIFLAFAGIMSLAFIVDLVETMRDVAGRDGIGLGLTIRMSLLKMPGLAEQILPFTVLLAGIWTFTRLTRTSELVVARAAGVSVWQFLMPALAIGVLMGVFLVTVFNPLSASMSANFNTLYARYVDGQTSQIQLRKTGLWLRQGDGKTQDVVHAREVDGENLELKEVIFISYGDGDRFTGRIDAASARLGDKRWLIEEAYVTDRDQTSTYHAAYEVPTSLDLEDLEDSFAAPETISFWDLPRFIEMAENAGFSATKHRLHWHSVLSQPFLLCAMRIIA
ncbi:MAG: LptF/LptG family permease, partial [Pseudomonadota bacterium]